MRYAKKQFTAKQIEKQAKSNDAKGFYEWLETNRVDYTVHDMCITDPNEDWFNVSIDLGNDECLDVIYAYGVLDEATVSEYSEI